MSRAALMRMLIIENLTRQVRCWVMTARNDSARSVVRKKERGRAGAHRPAAPDHNRRGPARGRLRAPAAAQLGDEDVIGFHRRLPPFQAKRMDWWRFDVLAKRRQMPVPQLHALPRLKDAAW